jgi:predicted protein tyrosine phosphatase
MPDTSDPALGMAGGEHVMTEVYPGLFVGEQASYESGVRAESDWAVVHACKEPYHRQALGYRGRAAPKNHPEYLIARRDNRLILNLVDADDPAYIPADIMDAAVMFIHEHLSAGRRVLVHCNQGLSRSPAIAMLYLGTHTDRLSRDSFEQALTSFRGLYPPFTPARGVLGFLRGRWASGLAAKPA